MAYSEDQAPAGQRYDPVDEYSGNQSLRYPVKSDLSVGWQYPPFEQLVPDQYSRSQIPYWVFNFAFFAIVEKSRIKDSRIKIGAKFKHVKLPIWKIQITEKDEEHFNNNNIYCTGRTGYTVKFRK